MKLSADAIIAIVTLFATCPPTLLAVWALCRRRRGQNRTNTGTFAKIHNVFFNTILDTDAGESTDVTEELGQLTPSASTVNRQFIHSVCIGRRVETSFLSADTRTCQCSILSLPRCLALRLMALADTIPGYAVPG
jgi:hypothetical protein